MKFNVKCGRVFTAEHDKLNFNGADSISCYGQLHFVALPWSALEVCPKYNDLEIGKLIDFLVSIVTNRTHSGIEYLILESANKYHLFVGSQSCQPITGI